jgi:hypothetical protein
MKKRREIEKKGREKQRNRQTDRKNHIYDPSCRTWSSGSSEVLGGENE